MHFAPKTHASLFPSSRRRPSLAPSEESEILSSIPPSTSTSWINPFTRASFSVEDDTYHPPSSPPSSRRPSAATIISTLLHGKVVGQNSNASTSTVRLSQDGSDGSDDVPSPTAPARRPSVFKAWKTRRGSSSQPQPTSAVSGGRRKSSALTRVLQPSTLRGTPGRVDEHSLSSSDTASRRRSLSIVCRGERDSVELPNPPRGEGEVTAAMAIRDTWLYGAHQWNEDGRKGSISTVATSTFSNPPRKSISGAVGLDVEDAQLHHHGLQQRLKQLHQRDTDASSVVSLSLTEEIALYTTDVEAVEYNAGKARRSVGCVEMAMPAPAPFVWNLPDWSGGGLGRLPELSPAPQVMIADPFRVEMQRGESGELDPVLAASPVLLAGVSETLAEDGHGVQWNEGLWNTASPFQPSQPQPPEGRRASTQRSFHSADDQSPTAPNFPPSLESPRSQTADIRRALRPSHPVHSNPRSPTSPHSFGHSETSYEMRRPSRLSYSHPRPPVEYSSDVSTPRLVGGEGSPMSSLFECETPCQAEFFEQEKGEGEEEDLHAQFCSALLLDLGDGRAIPLSPSPGVEARGDPFALIAC